MSGNDSVNTSKSSFSNDYYRELAKTKAGYYESTIKSEYPLLYEAIESYWSDIKDIKTIHAKPWTILFNGFIDDTKHKWNWLNGVEGWDYLVCPICGIKKREMTAHVKTHRKTWNEISPGVPSKCGYLRETIKGENNPGYKHGGKFSPFSKQFIKGYDAEWHESQISANSQMMKDSTTSTFLFAYWLEKFDGDEENARIAYGNSQRRGLEYFIDKYGSEEGIVKYHAKCNSWKETFFSKSDEEMFDIISRRTKKGSQSLAEKDLVARLQEYRSDLKTQFFIRESPNKSYMFDIKIDDLLIEFNGDYWHTNPKMYASDYYHSIAGMTAEEIWEADSRKKECAEKFGYRVHVVWEQDWIKNKIEEVNKCLQMLNMSGNLLMS